MSLDLKKKKKDFGAEELAKNEKEWPIKCDT